MSSAPTRRHGDFKYRLPDDLEFEPTKQQIASTARRAKGTTYRPLERRPIWPPYLLLVIGVVIMVGVLSYAVIALLTETGK